VDTIDNTCKQCLGWSSRHRSHRRTLITIPITIVALFVVLFIVQSMFSEQILGNSEIITKALSLIMIPGTDLSELTFPSMETIGSDPEKIAIFVHGLINEERKNHGLKPLGWNAKLAYIATKHSEDMALRNYFSHDSPEGHNFANRYSAEGFRCEIPISSRAVSLGGENIAVLDGYFGEKIIAENTVEGWMVSTDHRKNILTEYYETEGIGVAISGNQVFVTQNFC